VTWLWRAIGAVVAVLGCAGLVALSSWTPVLGSSAEGIVRLSWRAVGQRVEECRVLSEDELAALPAHMRRKEVCEGRLAPFALEAKLDGDPVLRRELRAAGAREDRPTYVFEELRVEPGPHRLDVVFAVAGSDGGPELSPLRLHAVIDVAPRSIVLVTRDDESGNLVVRQRLE